MFASTSFLVVFMTVMTTTVPATTAVEPPLDHTVTYLLRQDPSDLDSAVRYEVTVDLVADDWDSTTVDWDVPQMTIDRLDDKGEVERSWVASNPLGGLWSVSHADITNPVPSEFTIAPLLSGIAESVDGNSEDLIFTFESAMYDPIGPWPAIPTGAVNYDFETELSQALEATGEDEPAEIDGGENEGSEE